MRLKKRGLALHAPVARAVRAAGANGPETVVLLHGMGRTAASMLLLRHRLQRAGFRVVSRSYRSTGGTVEDHARWLDETLDECCWRRETRVHFVTHSLGGIVVRKYLAENHLPNLGRVVMLAPPNQGSELADLLRGWKLYQFAFGPSGQELGTDAGSTPNALGPVDFELGVVVGDKTVNPLSRALFGGPNDGKVSVARARVEGMQDFLVVNHSHAFIMNSARVAEETIRFLNTGAFRHREAYDHVGV
jgi:pimeloyl-ACP methyl ester carboxylesterase